MDTTIGQTLEKSLRRDIPSEMRPASVSVFSKPDKKPTFAAPKQAAQPAPEKAPVQEKRFAIEALPAEEQKAETREELVNSKAIQHLLLLKHFGIDSHPTTEETQKLRTIWDFAQKGSAADTVKAIIRLRNKLGAPTIGESLLDRVYRHVQLRRIQEYETL